MRDRVLFDGNLARVITSKPGFDANPAQADENKTFDSNWFYGGGIKFVLVADSRYDSVAYFPYALDYIPSIIPFTVMDADKEPVKNTFGGISDMPHPPADAKYIFLSGGGKVSKDRVYDIPIETNKYYNSMLHVLVLEA